MFLSGCNTSKEYLLAGTYTGTGSKGIYAYVFNGKTGATHEVFSTGDSITNPSFLIASGNYVYAVNENHGPTPGSVSAFAFDKKNGKLNFLNKVPSGGDDPCHLAVSADGKWLAVANYTGGSVAILPVKQDGTLKPYAQLIEHTGSSVNKTRQEKPHVHEVVFSPDGKYLFTPDLGLDKIMAYEYNGDNAQPLSPASTAFYATVPGSGPRHMAFGKQGKYAYIIHELNSTVTVCQYNDGAFTAIQTLPLFPEGYSGQLDGAEITVSADGKFLYTSQRAGLNTIGVFAIDENSGKLTEKQFVDVNGKGPRHFIMSPKGDYLVVANQLSDNIVFFKRDKTTGLLTLTGKEIKMPSPVALYFVTQ